MLDHMILYYVWEYIYPCSRSRVSAAPAAPPPPPEGPRWCSDPVEDTCKSEPVGFRVNKECTILYALFFACTALSHSTILYIYSFVRNILPLFFKDVVL